MYLDLPEQREGRDPGWRGDMKWAVKRSINNVMWMIITILAPEVVLGKYFGDLKLARYEVGRMSIFSQQDSVPWTTTHALLANMGGFVIRAHESKRLWVANKSAICGICGRKTKSGICQICGSSRSLPIKANEIIEAAKTGGSIYHLNGRDILALRECGLLPRLPYISLEEIQDRSKSDSMIRAIAVVQILWNVIQVLIRGVRKLAVSQLEIAVIAFAVCAIFMYGLNWAKPKGVQIPIVLVTYQNEIPPDIMVELASRAQPQGEVAWIVAVVARLFNHEKPFARPNIITYTDNQRRKSVPFATLMGSVVFGVIHITAWNFHFPTRIEQKLWWACSIWCTTCSFISILLLPSIVILVAYSGEKLLSMAESESDKLTERALNSCMGVCVVMYVLARLYLLVEIFRTLCFLPPSAYYPTWATNVPHVG